MRTTQHRHGARRRFDRAVPSRCVRRRVRARPCRPLRSSDLVVQSASAGAHSQRDLRLGSRLQSSGVSGRGSHSRQCTAYARGGSRHYPREGLTDHVQFGPPAELVRGAIIGLRGPGGPVRRREERLRQVARRTRALNPPGAGLAWTRSDRSPHGAKQSGVDCGSAGQSAALALEVREDLRRVRRLRPPRWAAGAGLRVTRR